LSLVTELACVVLTSFVDLGLEVHVHVSRGNRGHGLQADINTRRAGVHDMFTLVLNRLTFYMISSGACLCMWSTVVSDWMKLKHLISCC